MDIFVFLFLFVGFLIAVTDFLVYRIPNLFLVALCLLFLIYVFFLSDQHEFSRRLITGSVVLAAGFFLYVFRLIGAGDAKYLAVSSVWIGQSDLMLFFIAVTFMGGVAGLIWLVFRNWIQKFRFQLLRRLRKAKALTWMSGLVRPVCLLDPDSMTNEEKQWQKGMIPYGVPIFLASCLVMLQHHMQ